MDSWLQALAAVSGNEMKFFPLNKIGVPKGIAIALGNTHSPLHQIELVTDISLGPPCLQKMFGCSGAVNSHL